MKLQGTTKVLLSLAMTLGLAHAGVTAEFHSVDGNAADGIKTMTTKLNTIGYSTVANNENIQNFYYEKFKEKNVEMISFYTLVDKKEVRELLLQNPDFGAYIPFNFLTYKNLNEPNTWYGHLSPELMLDVIGCKDEASKQKFTQMVGKLDTFATTELKPNKSEKLEYTNALPKTKLTKMVMTFDEPEDLEEFVEEFVAEHDGAFSKHNFIIAGFIDLKFEYADMDLAFDKYDAYWVSSLCHFEFSNSIFNHGQPRAGVFAPCSVYFYIPKGTNELHVGYAGVENWVATTGITDEKTFEYMRKIDDEVVAVFEELGFELIQQTGNGDRERTKGVAKEAAKEPAKDLKAPVGGEENKPKKEAQCGDA